MEESIHIANIIKKSADVKMKIFEDKEILDAIVSVSEEIEQALKGGQKILFCGNGGSAADAQHLAAELSGRFYADREPLFAEVLHGNPSQMTAIANDRSYDEVFERAIRAMGREKDVLVALSTSGNSPNVIRAIQTANNKNMITVGFTGEDGGQMASLCKYIIKVPSNDIPRIQECHMLIGHIVCENVEKKFFTG